MTDLVVVDLGGTHARCALASVDRHAQVRLGPVETLAVRDFADFEAAWHHFRTARGGQLPSALSMAVAGPINADEIRFTNNPWVIRPAALQRDLGLRRLSIVNDFAAVAHAVGRLPEDDFAHLAGPAIPLASSGTVSVVGPGTGLGVAHLWRDGERTYHVQATEGGHIEFAPLDEVEEAIRARLRSRYGRVSVERVVSGPAIVDIHQALAAREGRAAAVCSDVELWSAALGGQDADAAAAAERFCLALGSVAGDIVLAQGAFAGLVIAGGLGLRLRERLMASGFAERFQAKGRFTDLMANIPVKLITHPQPGLVGAAAAFASEHLVLDE